MMIKNFFIKQKKLLIYISLIVLFFICLFVFVLKKPFLLENDQWFQYNIFYKEWIRLIIEFIKGHGLPMYSWNMYLGSDFYSAMGYYCTGDIFLPLLLLFRNNIELGLVIETILCVYIASIMMNIFLEKYDVENENIRIFISIIYAIGSEASIYFSNYMFHRFYAFLPLLFIGLLNYFNNRKVKTFIVATTILLLQSYYLMFPTLIFLFMFSLMLEIKMKKDIKIIFKDFFILLGCLIVGFMISAIITLPSIMYLLNNSRVGINSDDGILWQRNTYAGIYMSLISPNIFGIGGNIFNTSHHVHDTYYSLFIGIIPFASAICYLIKKENRTERYLFILLTIILCLKPLSSIMHAFSVPSLRWALLYEFYFLILGAKGLHKSNLRQITIISFIYICIFVFYIFDLNKHNYIDIYNMHDHLCILFASIIIALLILICFKFNKFVACLVSILEIMSFQSIYFYMQTNNSYLVKDAFGIQDVKYYEEKDDERGNYRYFINYLNNSPNNLLNINKSLDYGFMSTSTYSSTYEPCISVFNELSNSIKAIEWALTCDDPYANIMLGVKYYIVYKEDELPEELNFEYAYNLDYLKVYRNLNYKGFGYTASNLKYTKDFVDTKDFYDYILIDDDVVNLDKYQNISETKLNIIERHNNYLLADINLEEDNILLIPIPNNKGWKVKVNDELVNIISVNGGFIGIELNKGYNKIEMNFVSCYFIEGCVLSLFGLMIFGFIIYRDKRRGN